MGYFQKTNSLGYADNLNVDTFHYIPPPHTQNIKSVNITTDIVRGVFKYCAAVKFMVADISFKI